jgi:hypothetical protein
MGEMRLELTIDNLPMLGGNLEEQLRRGNIDAVSLSEIKSAIKQLSFEERAKLAAWFHGWKDDEWDPPPCEPISHYGVAGDQMKRDISLR